MWKRLIVCVLAVVMISCGAAAIRKADSSNKGVTVEVLTEFDGIRLYRVNDGERTVFVAVTRSELRASWQETCGKNCTRQVETLTARKER